MTAFTLNNKSKFDLFVIVIGIILTVSFGVKALIKEEAFLGAIAFMSALVTSIYAKYTDISSNI